MMLTKALVRSFKYSKKTIRTVCCTPLHIIEIDIGGNQAIFSMSRSVL